MEPARLGDGELVAKCLSGESGAWDELVERFSGYVYAILSRGFGIADQEAEDLFQEVFARLYERLGDLREGDAVKPWIAQTTRRIAIDRHRSMKREGPPFEDLPEAAELDARIESLDDALEVRAGLARLPDHCAEILLRFFVRDQSYREISEATRIPQGTIASRISRCLQKLRHQLEGRTEAVGASGKQETTS